MSSAAKYVKRTAAAVLIVAGLGLVAYGIAIMGALGMHPDITVGARIFVGAGPVAVGFVFVAGGSRALR